MFARILILNILILGFASIAAVAQINNSSASNAADASKASPRERDDDSPASRNMRETRERWRMEAEEKEHHELLERSDKAWHLTDELNKSFARNNAFTSNDAAKLTELEKLIKKIRKSLGGGGDDNDKTDETKPASLADAFNQLSEAGATLNDELKKQTRHELSADSIDKLNEMLDLVALIRNFSQSK